MSLTCCLRGKSSNLAACFVRGRAIPYIPFHVDGTGMDGTMAEPLPVQEGQSTWMLLLAAKKMCGRPGRLQEIYERMCNRGFP